MSDHDYFSDDGLFVKEKDYNGDHHNNEDLSPQFVVKEEGRESLSNDLYANGDEESPIGQGLNARNNNGIAVQANNDQTDNAANDHEIPEQGQNDQVDHVDTNMQDETDSEDGDFEDSDENPDEESDSGNGSGFRAGPRLPEAEVIRMEIGQLVQLVNNGGINLEADYQRDVVWNSERKSGLIKSIMQHYYIPPVIFNVWKEEDEETGELRDVRICVDGKQRLTSVKAFMDGMIPCKDRNDVAWYYKAFAGVVRNRRYFSEDERSAFRQRKLLCYELPNLTRDQEEDLFARVQMGMQLNNAEKLRASRGPWQDFADLYENDFPEVINLSGNRRSSGWLNVLACFNQMIEVECSDPLAPVLKTNANAIRALLNAKHLLTSSRKEEFRVVFTRFKELVDQEPTTFKNNNYQRVKTFAPIELITVAVLLFYYKGRTDINMLKDDILHVRERLRIAHRDLRMNSAVWQTCWELIENLESERGAADGSTVPQSKKRTARPKKGGKQQKKGGKQQGSTEDIGGRSSKGQGQQGSTEDTGVRSSESQDMPELAPEQPLRDSGRNLASSTSAETPQPNKSGRDMPVRSARGHAQPTNANTRTGTVVAPSSASTTAPVAPAVASSSGSTRTPVTPVANMISTVRNKRERADLSLAMTFDSEPEPKKIKVSPTSD